MANIKRQVQYWQESAHEDLKTMKALFSSKRYSAALFFGHIVLEKILKALATLETKNEAPKIHNLIRLAELANLELNQDEKDYLSLANDFNIRSRYEDYKKVFYKICTKEYVMENIEKITKIYQNLCQKLKQKEL